MGTWDNSAANRHNPDPTAAVKWGDQSWEEMLLGMVTLAINPKADVTALFEKPARRPAASQTAGPEIDNDTRGRCVSIATMRHLSLALAALLAAGAFTALAAQQPRPPEPGHREAGRRQDGVRPDQRRRPVDRQRAGNRARPVDFVYADMEHNPLDFPGLATFLLGLTDKARDSQRATCSRTWRCSRAFRPKPISRTGW